MVGILLTITAMFLGVCFVFHAETGKGEPKETRPENRFWEKKRC